MFFFGSTPEKKLKGMVLSENYSGIKGKPAEKKKKKGTWPEWCVFDRNLVTLRLCWFGSSFYGARGGVWAKAVSQHVGAHCDVFLYRHHHWWGTLSRHLTFQCEAAGLPWGKPSRLHSGYVSEQGDNAQPSKGEISFCEASQWRLTPRLPDHHRKVGAR